MKQAHPSSFRDPSGFIFVDKGTVKRQILPIYFKQYKDLTTTGFYKKLFDAQLLIQHKELSVSKECIVIQPTEIPFISYPYEWCFNQYKEAALLTLKIQKFSIENGFSLKDASAFNVSFFKGKAVFIDTLSFDYYIENAPWRAYKQFVMHFLGPLILAKYYGANSLKILQQHIDGVPLNTLSKLLPFSTKFNPFLYSNIHLLSKFEDKYKNAEMQPLKQPKLSKKAQINLLDTLYNYIKKLTLKTENSEWANYYDKINYSTPAFETKSNIIRDWVAAKQAKTLIDVGGNDGTFVRCLNTNIDLALVCDIDNQAVNINYKKCKVNNEWYILPLVIDILNPPASIGFQNKERSSFINRVKKLSPQITLALALIHHITLSGNVPFLKSAEFFATFSNCLIIEFPKRTDSWVKHLLDSKREFRHYFDFYNIVNFKAAYTHFFNIKKKQVLKDSERVLFLMERK